MTSLHNQSSALNAPVCILTLPTKREKEILLRRCKQNVKFGNIIFGYGNMEHRCLLKKIFGYAMASADY